MTYVKEECVVPGLGKILYTHVSVFNDTPINDLRAVSKIISLKDLSYAVRTMGIYSSVSEYGSYVSQGIIKSSIFGNNLILVNDFFDLVRSLDASKVNSGCNEYILKKNLGIESYLNKLGKENYSIIDPITKVPVLKLADNAATAMMFKNNATSYGRFLDSIGVLNLDVNFFDTTSYMGNTAFMAEIYSYGVNNNFKLTAGHKIENDHERIRGIAFETKQD